MKPELKTDSARQAKRGRHVLTILVAGLGLCVIVGAGVGIYASTMADSTLTAADRPESDAVEPTAGQEVVDPEANGGAIDPSRNN